MDKDYNEFGNDINENIIEKRQEELEEKLDLMNDYDEYIPQEDYNNRNNNKKKKNKNPSRVSYFLVALIAAIIGGIVSQMITPLFMTNSSDSGSKNEIVINPNDDINMVSAVAKTNMKSVVGITTVELVSDYYFFLPREVEGVGSGVIIDSNGYILTNSHVVGDNNRKSLEVLFEDGEKLPGQVLWSDPRMDLAVVKVEKTGLPAAKLGDSDSLEVGEPAIAIGNPLGLDFQRSVTAGIISGLNRTISVENTTMTNLIQTDASINRGNSGGPLFNSKGEVIGINTVKVGNAEGLGFSIPINDAKNILQQVIKDGKYEAISLGIKALNPEEFATMFEIENSQIDSVVVIEVAKNSPAEKAGLKQFDVIKKLGNKEITSREELTKELHNYKKGDSTTISVVRDNKIEELKIKF